MGEREEEGGWKRKEEEREQRRMEGVRWGLGGTCRSHPDKPGERLRHVTGRPPNQKCMLCECENLWFPSPGPDPLPPRGETERTAANATHIELP